MSECKINQLFDLAVSEAITQQGEWCSAKTDAIITQLFKELTYEMGIQEIIEILKRTLEEEEVGKSGIKFWGLHHNVYTIEQGQGMACLWVMCSLQEYLVQPTMQFTEKIV